MTKPISTACVASLWEALGNKWSAEVIRLASALRLAESEQGADPCYNPDCTYLHYGIPEYTATGSRRSGYHGRKLTKQQRARVARPLPPREGESSE